MSCCDQRCGLITGAVIGVLIAALGGTLIPVGDMVIEKTVFKETVLENGTLAFDTWTSVGTPIYRQFWIFDVQNAEDVQRTGEKPVLVQKGPYTYKIRFIPKRDITFNGNNTVSFLLPAGATFEPSMSVGTEEDVFTSLNLAVAGLYGMLGHKMANILIERVKANLFQNRTVKELLWGYKDPVLNTMIGVFYPYNDTTDGPYTVFTGYDDIQKVATIERWQGESSLKYWNNSYCDMINGTDGSSFHPFLDKKETLYFFSSDICRSYQINMSMWSFHVSTPASNPDQKRSISAEFNATVDLKGIDVYRFMLPDNALAAPVSNPDNQCYCTNQVITKNCTVAGVLDISSCRGFPVYISLPHFLHANTDLQQGVVGLNPNQEEHNIFLDVEPITGFTLRFSKRLQLNMVYGPSEDILILNQIRKLTFMPLLWLNETAVLDDETADMFKKELISQIDLLEGFQIGLLVIGSAIFVGCIIGLIVVCSKPDKPRMV